MNTKNLLSSVFLCAFGCQEAGDNIEIVKYAQISGQSYNGSSQSLEYDRPDGEYLEPRVSYQDLKFSEGLIERHVFVDLCRTKAGCNLCSEIYYRYPMFTITYYGMEVDEGSKLQIFFGNGQVAEFSIPESGVVYPDGIYIRLSDHDLSDTVDGSIEVPRLDEMPDSVYDYAREWLEKNELQREPDEYDAIL